MRLYKSLISAFLLFLLFGCKMEAQQKVFINYHQEQTPVLTNRTNSSLLSIRIVVPEGEKNRTISKLAFALSGSVGSGDVKSLKLWYMDKDPSWNLSTNAKTFGNQVAFSSKPEFSQSLVLESDTSYFLLTCDLNDLADISHNIGSECLNVRWAGGQQTKPVREGFALKQRLGVSVRKHMDDGVHTYRIPGLATTKAGSLLAIYDIRRDKSRDLQGDIDIGVSRSTNQGQTWEDMRIALDKGNWGGLPEKFNGISDANILVDEQTGTIYIVGLWMYGVLDKNGRWMEGLTEDSTAWAHQWRERASQPGFDEKQTSQFLLTSSTDDGKTWSEPVNLTKMCKKEEWWLWAPAPGHGITMADGTLVFPTQGRDKNGKAFSNITYSKDHGKTWKTSNPAYSNTTENMVAQLSDGSLMLNMRFNENRGNLSDNNGRVVCTTADMGETWTEHSTSRNALIEPTCMASLHKHIYHENGKEKSILLFSNPNSKEGRHHMTIKVSMDDGKTWPEKYWLLLDSGKGRGYSCLTSIGESAIGILYEGSQADMIFEKVELSDLLKK